jgi:RNA polymerase sigma-70 factor (ECF subfamily)
VPPDDHDEEFAWLFRAHFASVARTIRLIVGDSARAEEITQDAFTKLWQQWDTLAGYERPQAWARLVAVRMAVRDARRERTRPWREQRSTLPVLTPAPDLDLERALRTLTSMQRAAVVLHYYEDRPVAEIAAALRVSESTVKQHLFRARHRLAELLAEEVTGDVR